MKFLPKKLSSEWIAYLVVAAIWELFLFLAQSNWLNFILMPAGAIIGLFILEINWLFPKKEVLKILPIILLPLALFILTSTSGAFGKSIIVFLNLRLFLDKNRLIKDN